MTICGEGPVGSVTLPEAVSFETLRNLARSVAENARVPLVLFMEKDGTVHAQRSDGRRFRLPEQGAEVFGPHHPRLHEVVEDSVNLVRHESAGDLVLMGFNQEKPVSFQLERGAHGGPGPAETAAFALLPQELRGVSSHLRPDSLRSMALDVLEGRLGPSDIGSAAVALATSGRDAIVRVMTYNVHGCRGMDGRVSPQRIARVIAQQGPDIVCLQELDHARRRSRHTDQAMTIAAMLQSQYHFHAVNPLEDGLFGNVVLSIHPSRQIAAASLPRWRTAMKLEPRGVLWVEVDVRGVPLQVINTHLSILHWERLLQVDALLGEQWLQRQEPSGPKILCGDFNASTSAREMQRIGAVMRNVDCMGEVDYKVTGLKTWSSRLPIRRIDHVFVGRQASVRKVFVPRTRLTRIASDHLPLVVDLQILPFRREQDE
jgi:endonuclease/exonuclease/phosphatase family metal-dependent hydrolase